MGRGWRPLVVGALVVVATFVLAQFAVFEPSSATDAGVSAGDFYRGGILFEESCASCHGVTGEGGGPGPRLAGAGLDAAAISSAIEQGRGVMPPALVSGQDRADVVAYVVVIGRP
jgi:mono/diheme cytochrome c family protein